VSESTQKGTVAPGSLWKLAEPMLFASFGQGGIVFNLDTREVHRLNPTGASVLGLLDGRRDVGAIIEALSRENEAPRETVAADVERFLEDIMKRGWINGS